MTWSREESDEWYQRLLQLEDRVSRVELELARMRHAEPDTEPEIGPQENLVPFLPGRERAPRRRVNGGKGALLGWVWVVRPVAPVLSGIS